MHFDATVIRSLNINLQDSSGPALYSLFSFLLWIFVYLEGIWFCDIVSFLSNHVDKLNPPPPPRPNSSRLFLVCAPCGRKRGESYIRRVCVGWGWGWGGPNPNLKLTNLARHHYLCHPQSGRVDAFPPPARARRDFSQLL